MHTTVFSSLHGEPAARPVEPGLLALSLWMRAFFVGVSMSVVGIVALASPATRTNGMLAVGAVGLALAFGAFRETRRALRATTAAAD